MTHKWDTRTQVLKLFLAYIMILTYCFLCSFIVLLECFYDMAGAWRIKHVIRLV